MNSDNTYSFELEKEGPVQIYPVFLYWLYCNFITLKNTKYIICE